MMVVKHTVTPSFEYHPLAMQIEGGYSVTEGPNQKDLFKNGWNMGLGLTWFPSSELPFGLRVDGSYSRFETTGADVARGHEAVYGGDADLELDLRMGPGVKEYFLGGVGWYRTQTVFRQVNWEPGEICWWYCVPGYIGVPSTVQRTTSDWQRSWNAGVGFEFALDSRASFFVDARYVRMEPYVNHTGFVPIRIGLRF
jgi:opacity protein-like surface antigen